MSNWHEVASVADFKKDDRKYIEVADEEIGIFKVGEEYHAISIWCSHARVSLMNGFVDEHCIQCPAHGAEFDLRDGSHMSAPAVRPVDSFPVKVEGDKIFVQVEE